MNAHDALVATDRIQQAADRADHALRDRDAAANQLARYVSDQLADGAIRTTGEYDELREYVEIFNEGYEDWRAAREEWHRLTTQFVQDGTGQLRTP